MTKSIRNHSLGKLRNNGFTLIEIMVVVITLGVISSLALINYNKVIERGHCTNARNNLRRIHSAAQIYALKHAGSISPLSSTYMINQTFNINIVDPYFSYSTYPIGSGAITSTGYAARFNGPSYTCSSPFGIPLDSANPSCNSAEFCDHPPEGP